MKIENRAIEIKGLEKKHISPQPPPKHTHKFCRLQTKTGAHKIG